MYGKTWAILLGIVAMGFLAHYALSQSCTPSYSPGSATIGDIQTSCVDPYPPPQSRTDVGIGELVTCWIDESTWQGTAIYTDRYCNRSTVPDGLKSITWSVVGDGTVYPTTGYETTLTVGLADADGIVTVLATAVDMLGVDPPVKKAKAMNDKVPTGINPIGYTDYPPYQKGTDLIGCRTVFLQQVLPQSVNFNNTNIRENLAKYTWDWPNGSEMTSDERIVGPNKPRDHTIGVVTFPNVLSDDVSSSGTAFVVDLLKSNKTNEYVDWDKPIRTVPLQYQDDEKNWVTFNTGTHPRHWTGASKTGRCGIVASGTLWGKDQGPFKKPN